MLKRDHLPAYITWDRYLANQQRMRGNRNRPNSSGVPRWGTALLPGLLVCGTCGRRMRPCYRHPSHPGYGCNWHLTAGCAKTCPGLNAAGIDDLVGRQVLRALEPAALELSLQAEADADRERERLHRHWRRQLERARYEVERAERQYQAVEPENRLVARTLERRWEEALGRQRQLQEEYDRFLRDQPARLTEGDRRRIRALAADLPALWRAPSTSAADRKEIIRCPVEKVVVRVRNDSEYVGATIHWRGGSTSTHELVRPVPSYARLRDFERLRRRLAEMRRAGLTAAGMADRLNREGFAPPRRGGPFSPELVRQLLCRQGLSSENCSAARGCPARRPAPRRWAGTSGGWRGWRGSWGSRRRRRGTGWRGATCTAGKRPPSTCGSSGRIGTNSAAFAASSPTPGGA